MKSIHFKCEREGSGFHRLSVVDRDTHKYCTCCWDITVNEAREVIGGWVYLHPIKKSEPSEFGGKIVDFEEVLLEEKGHPRRIALIFESRKEARKQIWRGKNYGMAFTGGPVPASFPHEYDNVQRPQR